MTEIVDDRQRLVARLRYVATPDQNGWRAQLAPLFTQAADQIEQDGKRLSALASPSEGNKKGDVRNQTYLNGEREYLTPEALAARTSRPQEQPRKATGEPDYTAMDAGPMLQALGADAAKWATAFRQMALKLGYSDMDEGWLIGWFANAIETADLTRHPRSVSPAAAQGWQMVPKVLTDMMMRAGGRPPWPGNAHLTGNSIVARWDAMLAAAPPSPQEQEKGEQT